MADESTPPTGTPMVPIPDPQPSRRADARLAALFPEPDSIDAHPNRRRRRTAAIACVVVVALLVAALGISAAFGSSGSEYRTAVAGPQQVDSVLTGVATIEPVAQAAVAFPVSGTVASVNVKVGDPVTAGGVLASLDAQSLEQALHTKEASLAQAQLTLEKALSGQSVGGVGSSGSGSGSSSFGASSPGATASAYRTGPTASAVLTAFTPPSTTTPAATPGSDPVLAADQQAVLAAQQRVDAAMHDADAAVSAVGVACAAFLGASAPAASASPPAAITTPDPTACQHAITAAQSAQQALAAAQKDLAAASSALDAALAQRAATPPTTTVPASGTPAAGGPGAGGATGATGANGSGGASTTGASRTGSTSGSSPTAADLVADQASVDAATYAVSAAQQAVDAAVIASPLAGTVVGVNMNVGDRVSANSSTEDVVVAGTGGYEISTSISVDNLPSVSVGQPATVVPDGLHHDLTGKVVAIGVVPASTSATATLYHVIVGLTNPNVSLHDGATGTVSIVTKHARAALAVPTSAVTTTRNRHVVTVLRSGSPTVVAVQTGVTGSQWTEITSGLRSGDEVVLADASAPLPGSATASTGSTTGITNRFGGAGGTGGFGGGFRGTGGGARG